MNKLNENSIVKTDDIYRIAEEQIICKIGKVELEKVKEYKKLYLKYNK